MTRVGLVWAQSTSGVIGRGGDIPWRVPEDLARFKQVTMGHTVVMGRRTWDSLPASVRPLPGRRNVVLSRRADFAADGAEVVGSLEQAFAKNLATTGSIRGHTPRINGWTSEMVVLRCTAIANPAGSTGFGAYRGGEVIYVITASSRFVDPSLGFFAFLRLDPPVISVSHSERAIGAG